MAMKKYGGPERLVTFTGEQVTVLDNHLSKTGKVAVSDLTDKEYKELSKELDSLDTTSVEEDQTEEESESTS